MVGPFGSEDESSQHLPHQAAARHPLNQTDPPDRSAQHGELEHYQDSLFDSLQSPYLCHPYVQFIIWHDQIRK